VEELYQKYFDPLIQIHKTLTYAKFAEAFIFSGLVDGADVDLAFDGIVDKEEMLDSVRIKEVIL
jgi:hypothetical protein